MADDTRPSGPRRTIDWLAIRAAYEAGETNVSALSRKFSVKRESIIAHRDKDKWTTTGQSAGHLSDKVIELASRRVADKIDSSKVDAIAETVMDDLAEHYELSKLAVRAAKRTAERFMAGKIHPGEKQNEADVLNALLTGMSRAATIGRTVHGLGANTPSVGENANEKTRLVEWDVIPLPAAAESA